MSAPRDATRVLADCPCSGCNATRVLAAMTDALHAIARVHWREMHRWRRIYGDPYKAPEIRNLAHAQATGHEFTLRALLAVRRAARGGRDGGGE